MSVATNQTGFRFTRAKDPVDGVVPYNLLSHSTVRDRTRVRPVGWLSD